MKFSLFILMAVFHLHTNILASPAKGGIGDGNIHPAKQAASKPKTTTTYYAKPLHAPSKKPSGPSKPKPEVFKVIIENQPSRNEQPAGQEQIFKIIHLPKHSGGSNDGRKSEQILKIVHIKQSTGANKGGGSK